MLVEFTPGKPVICSEHGVLAPPAAGGTWERVGGGIIALLHLRDAHGKDVDGAIRKVLEELKREADQNSQPGR
jgi:hypothetical protein